jgi:nucleoid-associated protein YgaU
VKRCWVAVFGVCGYAGALAVLHPRLSEWPRGSIASVWSWLREDPQRALVTLTGALGWLLAAWLFLVTALAIAGTGAGAGARAARRLTRVITPVAVRRILEVAIGTAVVAVGPASSALAASAPVPVTSSSAGALAAVPPPVVAPSLAPLPSLDRTSPHTTVARPAPEKPPPAPPVESHTVERHTVAAGDTLWSIAVHDLPAGATPLEITRAWQQWYFANRAQIGDNPGLLLPGELLVAPRRTS